MMNLLGCFRLALMITIQLQGVYSAKVTAQPGEDIVTLSRIGDLVLKDLDKHEEAMVSRFFKALRKRVDQRILKLDNAAKSAGYQNESRERKLKLNKDEKKMIVKFFTALNKLKKEKMQRKIKSQNQKKKERKNNESDKVGNDKKIEILSKTEKTATTRPAKRMKEEKDANIGMKQNEPFQVEDDSLANRHKHTQSHQVLHDHLQNHEHAHDHDHQHSHSNSHEETHMHNHKHTHYHDHNHIRTHLEKHDHLAEYHIKEW